MRSDLLPRRGASGGRLGLGGVSPCAVLKAHGSAEGPVPTRAV